MSTISYCSALKSIATNIRSATTSSALVVLSITAAIGVCGCGDKAAAPRVPSVTRAAPQAACAIVGFYEAPDNGGTFVRTVKKAHVKVGDAVLVTGTGLYDGNWTVLQILRYRGVRDTQLLWGYLIEPKWQGVPPGFIKDDGYAVSNAAMLQPLPAGETATPLSPGD